MASQKTEFLIPLKKLQLGTFETDKLDGLKIAENSLIFAFDGGEGVKEIKLESSDISKTEQNFEKNENHIRLFLRPKKGEEISEKVPEGFEFKFYPAEKTTAVFRLHFYDEISDGEIEILKIFFDLSKSDKLKQENPLEVDDVEESTEDSKGMKKKAETLGDSEVPVSKKSRKSDDEEESRPRRNLRSKTAKNKLKLDENDYYPDDFTIPEELRNPGEKTPPRRPPSPSPFDRFENTQVLLTYLTASNNEIIIRMEDYKCLDRKELLSDVVIDFYLQYIYQEKMTAEQREKVHIYTTHFYRYLSTSSNFLGWKENYEKGMKASEKRYERVKDFPCNKEVNIFEKDFIVFPCISNEHWFLTIACFPKLNGCIARDNGERLSDDECARDTHRPVQVSCVLVFDSVRANPSRKNTAAHHVKHFLMQEYNAKYQNDFEFEFKEIKTNAVLCPQQSNVTDCGLFVLQFMEHFFIHAPIEDFRLPIKLSDWFDPSIIYGKREEIANVIRELMLRASPDEELPELPNISFHVDSQDVQIVEPDENGNGNNNDNNNQEEFNNNNDFNAIDNNNAVVLQVINSNGVEVNHNGTVLESHSDQMEVDEVTSNEINSVPLEEENLVTSTMNDEEAVEVSKAEDKTDDKMEDEDDSDAVILLDSD